MTDTQIKDYLKKYRIDSEESLAKHIEELKRNTIPNNEIIFPLVDLLLNEKSVLLSFFRENSKETAYTRTVTPFFLEDVLEAPLGSFGRRGRVINYSTRHKSKNGETHVEKELPSFNSKSNFDYLKEYTERLVGQSVQDTSDEIKESSGKKTNIDKPQISLLFKQFPKALEAIVRCSEYGHKKYKETDKDYLNYTRVEGGSKTYADAGLRHRLQHGEDLESGLPHQFHVAWNALAELQLWITENE